MASLECSGYYLVSQARHMASGLLGCWIASDKVIPTGNVNLDMCYIGQQIYERERYDD